MNPSDKFLESAGLESASAMSRGAGMQMTLFEPHDEDSLERETVLGMHLTNPYLKTNMQQAYTHFGLDANKAVINNLYVRFLPADVGQLRALDSIMEGNGLELFDTPADYEVLYEGDYYQDPSIPDENITWQYAVVPPSFSFPAGIQHVKFKNEYAQIRKLRGAKFWQMLFPIKATLGVFSGDKSAIERTFVTFVDRGAKGNSYWVGATALNAVQEYRTFAAAENIGLPPQGLKIILTNWGGGGSAPMFAKRAANDLPAEFVTSFLGAPVAILAAVTFTLKQQIDITASYSFDRLATMASDRVKETMYHELTHAAHYQKLGNSWYTTFVNMELMANVYNLTSGYAPYGDGGNPTFSPIIALGEGWAYYMGHYMADLRYGTNASCQSEQTDANGFGIPFCPSGTNHPHLDVEENFNPNLSSDPFKWIPQGLFYDLWDNTPNELIVNGFPVNDNVSGYANQQMFGAFQSNIYTLHDYRVKLLQQTSNSTSANVPNLFSQYHYQ